ncbi:putative N-acetyltransferase 16 [Acipenser ruthenus]|uniref:Putative N-acetyltransferase 16 n=1 Tax=Acipenser ruthenus TaxID=7906 RepID=A0A662YLT9_ACIRT|nr:putative N-acetyltransferase 16 [Acipenser ruthenus]
MSDTTATRADSEIEFCLAREEDYDDVMAISDGIYSGMDYLPARYHLWMKEPHRLVFLGKRRGRVIALESTILVDGGETVIVEGLRVAPEERGRGVAGLIQSHVAQFIKTHYPRVRTKRLTRGDNPGPQALAKFRVLATRREELRSLLLSNPGAVDKLLPAGTIIQDWQPLRPTPANLDTLETRPLSWAADRRDGPAALVLCTAPYPIPQGGGSLRLNLDVFGRDLPAARRVLVFQMERVRGALGGGAAVILNVYSDPALWEGLRELCEGAGGVAGGVRRYREYWEQLLLETDF